MSLQFKDYTSKSTGITTRKFYAAVWDAGQGKLITGPYRNVKGPKLPSVEHLPKALEKQLRLDEAALIEAIASGTVQKRKSGQTVDSVVELWLEASKPPVYADATWRIYQEFYERYIKEVFGDRPVNKVSSVHIQRYINIIKEKYSPETVNKCITVLKNIFSFAAEPLKEITVNPVDGIQRIKVPKRKRVTWNDEVIQYFLNLAIVKNSPYYPMLCISLILGSRPGEVCGLKQDALVSNPMSLVFDSGLNRYGNETEMKTDGSHRQIPIPEALYKAIRRHIRWKQIVQMQDHDFAKNDYLFVSPKGNPIKPDRYSKIFKRLIEKHNKSLEDYQKEHEHLPDGAQFLPDIDLYGCRHSFATNALADKYDPALISSIMGNSVKTLLTFYAHPDAEQQKELITNFSRKVL